MSIRLVLVDDHEVLRAGLKVLLEEEPDIQVINEAANGREAIETVRQEIPDVVVMDIGMPELNGIEATRYIKSEFPQVKVLVLSMHSDKRFVLSILKAGASGYLLKSCIVKELTRAIKTVVQNQTYISPAVSSVVVEELMQGPNPRAGLALNPLTCREREVLQLIAEGKSTKQVSGLLHVSVSTVETHRRQIMDKLNLHSVAELTKYALKEGLTFLEI